MLTSVFAKTLRDQRKALTGWGLGVALTVILMGAIWPSFRHTDFNKLMENYPETLKKAFNITDMSTGSGYLNAELFSFMVPVMFIVFAVGRGSRLVAGEEEDGTLETLATLPLTRTRLLIEKAGALAAGVGVLAVVQLLSLGICSLAFGMGMPVRDAFNASLAMFLFGFEFGLLALAVSAATGRRAMANGVAGAVAGASYLLFVMARILKAFRPYENLSAFHQALAKGPIGPHLPSIAVVMAVAGIAAIAVAAPLFSRRDLAV